MPLPPVVYATFSGPIDGQAIGRIFGGFGLATQNGVSTIHLLFQSTGGGVGDGVSLYNFFRGLPFELHIYNTGIVQSIAVAAFLGAPHRHSSEHATFLLHNSTFTSPNPTTAANFRKMVQTLDIEDSRIDRLLKAHITMPPKKWRERAVRDLTLTASEAVQYGIAQDIVEFVVPSGSQLFNL
jgi:ATP-dependent Clp protease, protease subunit